MAEIRHDFAEVVLAGSSHDKQVRQEIMGYLIKARASLSDEMIVALLMVDHADRVIELARNYGLTPYVFIATMADLAKVSLLKAIKTAREIPTLPDF